MYSTQLFDVDEIPKGLLDCFEEVETECGAPWERVTEMTPNATHGNRQPKESSDSTGLDAGQTWNTHRQYSGTLSVTTTGWRPTCAHDHEPIPCTVLDPFAGACTVGLVADRLGRDSIMIELNPEYAAMGEQRINDDAGWVADVEVTTNDEPVQLGLI